MPKKHQSAEQKAAKKAAQQTVRTNSNPKAKQIAEALGLVPQTDPAPGPGK